MTQAGKAAADGRGVTALRRVVRVMTLLSEAGDAGVSADQLVDQAGYRGQPEGQREMLKRDLRHLERQGWSIVNLAPAGAPARYRLEQGDPRVRLYFNEAQRTQFARAAALAGVSDEAAAVSSSPGAGEAEGERGAESLRLKILRAPGYVLAMAMHGHEHRCLLHFTYHDRERTVSSDAVWMKKGRWYLVGREAPGESSVTDPAQWTPRQYRLDRMSELRLDRPGTAGAAEGSPELNTDPLTYADGDLVEAEVAVSREFRRRAERALGRALSATRDGDEVVLRIPVVSHTTFRNRLYELGTRVRLLGPESLRDEVRADLLAHVRPGAMAEPGQTPASVARRQAAVAREESTA